MVTRVTPTLELPGQRTLLDDFSDLASWTKTAADTANADITEDTTYVKYGTKSFKFSTTASTSKTAFVTKDESLNLNGKPGIWVVGYKPFDLASGNSLGLTMYLSDAAALAAGTGRFTIAPSTVGITPGWFGMFIQNADWSTLDGTPSFANVQASWRFRIDSTANEAREFYIDSVHQLRTRPKVVITFDDGWATSYSAAHAYTEPLGVPLTHYSQGTTWGTAGFVTRAQVAEMKAAGDYIGVHGENAWKSLDEIKEDIYALDGLSDCKHASWPNGVYGSSGVYPTGYALADAAGFLTVRSVSTRILCPLAFERRALTTVPLNNNTTLTAARAWVTEAITSGGTLIFYGHKIDSAADSLTWTTSDFQALVNDLVTYRNQGVLDIVTIDDWYKQVNGIRS